MADNKAMRFSAPDSNESRIIRPLALADLEGLMQVQEACYGRHYMESAAVYRARIACADGCRP